jgi:diacylglycerol O-acyltransferase
MERLTAQDLSMLWPDDFGWPQDIGVVAILDGTRVLGADGRLRIEAVREAIERHLHLIPRFRQLLYTPRRGLGRPVWVDAPSFNLTEHVQVLPLAAHADEAQLLLAAEQLRRRRLDRSRPLWEMWLLPGLPQRRVGFFMKVHHTIADGVAGVALFGALLDVTPDLPATPVRPWTPAPMPTTRDLLADNLHRRTLAVDRAFSKSARPLTTLRDVRHAWPAVHEAFAEQAPQTSLNRPIGGRRRLVLVRTNLELVRQIAHAHSAKLNDVLMTVVAGGLRELVRSRGEPVGHLVLRAFVPVSLHREQPGPARGNLDGAMVVPLPVGVPDPVRRLRLITAETAARKKISRPSGGAILPNGVVQKAFLRLATRQRMANAYVANVPGPATPLYLAGAPLLEVFPVVPLLGNLTLGVGALSYAGQFNITVVADGDACPDVDVFADGVRDALLELKASVLEAARKSR